MPLTIAAQEKTHIIRKVGGKEETRKFLEGIGFVTGSKVTVLSKVMGSVIVSIKGARIAIGQDIASKILV